MAAKILLNRKIVEDKLSFTTASRLINYGEGFFETILYEGGRLFFYEAHLQRMKRTCAAFKISLNLEGLTEQLIEQLICENKQSRQSLRVKLIYAPLDKEWGTILFTRPYRRQVTPLLVCMHSEGRHYLARFKSLNYLGNLHWKNYYQQQCGAHEVLFAGKNGGLLEGSFTNLFYVSGSILYCADSDNDYLTGIMQEQILNHHRRLGFKGVSFLKEGIPPEALFEADEVFLTNSLLIARPIGKFYQPEKNLWLPLASCGWAEKIREYFLREN